MSVSVRVSRLAAVLAATMVVAAASASAALAVSGSGRHISAREGVKWSGNVAHFSDVVVTPSEATIDWGDGQRSSGTIEPTGDGGYDVGGAHTYASKGSYDVTTNLDESGYEQTSATGLATVEGDGGSEDTSDRDDSHDPGTTAGDPSRDPVTGATDPSMAVAAPSVATSFATAERRPYTGREIPRLRLTLLGLSSSGRSLRFALSDPARVVLKLRRPGVDRVSATHTVEAGRGVTSVALPKAFQQGLAHGAGVTAQAIGALAKSLTDEIGFLDGLKGQYESHGPNEHGVLQGVVGGTGTSKVIALAGYYAPTDDNNHVIVASYDSDSGWYEVDDFFFRQDRQNQALGKNVIGKFLRPVRGVAAYYAPNDHYQHVLVATDIHVLEFYWDPSDKKNGASRMNALFYDANAGIVGLSASDAPTMIGNSWDASPQTVAVSTTKGLKLLLLTSPSDDFRVLTLSDYRNGSPTWPGFTKISVLYSLWTRSLMLIGARDQYSAHDSFLLPLDVKDAKDVVGRQNWPFFPRTLGGIATYAQSKGYGPDHILAAHVDLKGYANAEPIVNEYYTAERRVKGDCQVPFHSQFLTAPDFSHPSLPWCKNTRADIQWDLPVIAGYFSDGDGKQHVVTTLRSGQAYYIYDGSFDPVELVVDVCGGWGC